jgi:hypothetical protein
MEQTEELYNLSRLIIERAYPKDTDMTPELLIDIIRKKVEEVFA